MRAARLFALFSTIALLQTATAGAAAGVDMNEPLRSLAREDNVRIDAQLMRDTVSPGYPVAVTYQIENFSTSSVAFADKSSSAAYDDETRTITIGFGSEVPEGGTMPHLVVIAPGEKKVFHGSATPVLNIAAIRAAMQAPPRYVQIKVTILRDPAAFTQLIEQQHSPAAAQPLPDELFDKWLEASDTMFLNALPVRWLPRSAVPMDAEQRGTE